MVGLRVYFTIHPDQIISSTHLVWTVNVAGICSIDAVRTPLDQHDGGDSAAFLDGQVQWRSTSFLTNKEVKNDKNK